VLTCGCTGFLWPTEWTPHSVAVERVRLQGVCERPREEACHGSWSPQFQICLLMVFHHGSSPINYSGPRFSIRLSLKWIPSLSISSRRRRTGSTRWEAAMSLMRLHFGQFKPLTCPHYGNPSIGPGAHSIGEFRFVVCHGGRRVCHDQQVLGGLPWGKVLRRK